MRTLGMTVGLAIMGLALGSVYASETVEGAKKDLQEFKKEMSTRMDAIEKQLDDLKSKANENGKAVKEKTVKNLEETKDKLHGQLEEMKYDGEKNYKDLKSKFAKALDSFNAKVQKALKAD